MMMLYCVCFAVPVTSTWHIWANVPVTVAAFTAAQKVAATHVDITLNADQERVAWAKKSLTRWRKVFQHWVRSSSAKQKV